MIVDVIMLSKGDGKLKTMTQRAVNSIIASEYAVQFHIVVVETIKDVTYKNCTVVCPEKKFNYNEFTKIGYDFCKKGEFVLFVNNDILAEKGFCTKLIDALNYADSVSPCNPRDPEHKRLPERLNYGKSIWQPSRFCGWAFLVKRSLIDEIGIDRLFPNELHGWYSDNWFCEMLDLHNKTHALVKGSNVTHLQSQTLISLSKEEKHFYTHEQKDNYDKLLGGIE